MTPCLGRKYGGAGEMRLLVVFFLMAREVELELFRVRLLLELRKNIGINPPTCYFPLKSFPQKFPSKMDTQFLWQLKLLWVVASMAGG